MKQFRAKHKDGLPDPGPVFSALPPSESNWLRDLHSMVNLGAQSHFTNDLSLNLNPCITTGASLSTDNSTRCGKSVFSSEFSSSTLQPSGGTAPSARKQITEDSRDDVSQNPQDLIAHRLHTLWQDISYVVSQHRTSTINLSTAAINVAHRLKDFVALLEGLTTAQPWSFSAYNNDDVRRILKMFLHLYDNLLQDDAFMKLKLMLCKAFNDSAPKVRVSPCCSCTPAVPMPQPDGAAVRAPRCSPMAVSVSPSSSLIRAVCQSRGP